MDHTPQTEAMTQMLRVVEALEDAPGTARAVLAKWDSYSEDDKDRFAEDFDWLLRATIKTLHEASADELQSILSRIRAAASELVAMREELSEQFGTDPKSILEPELIGALGRASHRDTLASLGLSQNIVFCAEAHIRPETASLQATVRSWFAHYFDRVQAAESLRTIHVKGFCSASEPQPSKSKALARNVTSQNLQLLVA